MKLLADAMLGRLARYLRILGYDTAYLADTDDFAVMRLARAEGRLLLTRDCELAARPGVRALLIDSEVLDDQLEQVWAAAGPPPDGFASRCPICNHPLVEVEPDLVADRVPPYVRRTQQRFTLCAACGRVYWQGSHWQRMRSLITRFNDKGVKKGLRDAGGSATMEQDAGDS